MKTNILRRIGTSVIAASVLSFGAAAFALNSTTLEAAIYAEETEGNLDKAIGLYQTIIKTTTLPKADRANAAYRLAQCYELKGDIADSKTLLTQLIDDTENPQHIVSDAKTLLLSIEQNNVELLPVSWENGEELYYSVSLHTGRRIGSSTLISRTATIDGEEVWLLDNLIRGGGMMRNRTYVRHSNFMPILAKTNSPQLGLANAEYGDKAISTTFIKKQGDEVKTQALTHPVYDVSQINHLLRRLPLQQGYTLSIKAYQAIANMLLDVDITVTDSEVLTLGSEAVDTFKVEAQLYFAGTKIQALSANVEKDGARRVVKTDDGTAISQLEYNLYTTNFDAPRRVFENVGLAYKTNANHAISDLSFQDSSVALRHNITPPNFKNRITVTAITPESNDNGDEMMLPTNKRNSHLKSVKKRHKSAEEREGMPNNFLISGQTTESFSLTVTDKKGVARVITNIYTAKNNNLYYFTITVKEEDFEKELEGFKTFLSNVELF